TNKKDKGPARVRLRFWREEVWDITLEEPDSTVGVELWSVYPPDMRFSGGEEPIVQLVLYVAGGTAQVQINYSTFGDLKAPPGRHRRGRCPPRCAGRPDASRRPPGGLHLPARLAGPRCRAGVQAVRPREVGGDSESQAVPQRRGGNHAGPAGRHHRGTAPAAG